MASLSLGLLSGCESSSTSSPQANASARGGQKEPPSASLLRPGMSKTHVINWMGEPTSKEPPSESSRMREKWVYLREIGVGYKTIVAEMDEVPYVDPFTGQMTTIQQPRQRQQRITTRERVELFFQEDTLVDIQRELDESKEFDQ